MPIYRTIIRSHALLMIYLSCTKKWPVLADSILAELVIIGVQSCTTFEDKNKKGLNLIKGYKHQFTPGLTKISPQSANSKGCFTENVEDGYFAV